MGPALDRVEAPSPRVRSGGFDCRRLHPDKPSNLTGWPAASPILLSVRAVTAGKFTLPPVEAEAMYDPRIWAREAGTQVEVAGPWKDYLL